jgi:ribosomal protein L19
LEIACLAGLVWITDGVSGDRVIQSGQQTTLRSKSKICVQAFTPSVIRIRPSAPAASALIRNQNSNFEMGTSQPPVEAL